MSYQQSYGNQSGYADYQPHGSNPYAQDVEMGAMPQSNGQQQPASQSDLLHRCDEIKRSIQDIKVMREGQLVIAQNAMLESNTQREDQVARQALDNIEDTLNNTFRNLRDYMKRTKEMAGAGSGAVQTQLSVASRNLTDEFEQYQKSQRNFQNRLKDQVRRRYQIANPEATPEELEQGVQNVLYGGEQAFQVTGARTRAANDARKATQERSAAIRKIEQDMVEISRLVQEVADLVHQQEPALNQIQADADNAATNIANANTQLNHAVDSARRARRWKWYALITVILIIAIVVGVAVGVTQAGKA